VSIFAVLFFPRIARPQPTLLFSEDSKSAHAPVAAPGFSPFDPMAWHPYCYADGCHHLTGLFSFTIRGAK
jgi:hypothetical protein